jgi:cystathionine beta-lyase/cystathionine gamma-synthase
MPRHPETNVLHTGERAAPAARPLNRPIYASSTFVSDDVADVEAYQEGRSPRYLYSRYGNPTVESAEEKVAVLEGAEAALVFASGQAASSTALLGLLGPGDELVCSHALYGGTLKVIGTFLERIGVRVRFATIDELAEPAAVISDATRMIWIETPTNPTLRCVDISRVVAACRARDVISVVDNTFATPVNQQPIALGVDLVMHSATKYLNGHSDVLAGALAGSKTMLGPILEARSLLGGILDATAGYALARGIKTLRPRMALHNSNGQTVAEWLEGDRRVSRVLYPGLPSHPDHAVARAQMRGCGGMMCVELAGGDAAARRFFDRLQLIVRATSLGGVESLCSIPVLTSHYGFSDDELAQAGVSRAMVRLSIGLEHADDLIADLDQALG